MTHLYYAHSIFDGDDEIEVQIEPNDKHTYRVTIDGELIEVDARPMPHGGLHLILNGEAYDIDMYPEQKLWHMLIRGVYHAFEVLDPRMHQMKHLKGTPTEDENPDISTPMAGTVVQVNVEEGQQVEADCGLVILEAMKMENEIRAPRAGTVEGLRVKAGDSVEVGATLLRLV